MRFILMSLLMLSIQACSFSGSPPPEEHFYRLPDAVADKIPQHYDRIYFRNVMAEGIYNERAILYVQDDSPLEVRRYHYHYWLNTPAKLIHEQLKNYLLTSGISRQLVDRHMGDHQLELDVRLKNFERLTGSANRVLVSLEVIMRWPGQNKPAMTKTYRQELPVGSSMHDTASGFGQVLSSLFARILADLQNLKKS